MHCFIGMIELMSSQAFITSNWLFNRTSTNFSGSRLLMRALGHMQPEMTLLVKLPIRLIEEKFGAGNLDEAGDAVLGVLSSLGMRTRCTAQWNFDTAHPTRGITP